MHKSQLHEVGLMFFAHTDSISSGYMTVISHETYLVAFTYSHGCYWEKLSLDLTLDSYKSRSILFSVCLPSLNVSSIEGRNFCLFFSLFSLPCWEQWLTQRREVLMKYASSEWMSGNGSELCLRMWLLEASGHDIFPLLRQSAAWTLRSETVGLRASRWKGGGQMTGRKEFCPWFSRELN